MEGILRKCIFKASVELKMQKVPLAPIGHINKKNLTFSFIRRGADQGKEQRAKLLFFR